MDAELVSHQVHQLGTHSGTGDWRGRPAQPETDATLE